MPSRRQPAQSERMVIFIDLFISYHFGHLLSFVYYTFQFCGVCVSVCVRVRAFVCVCVCVLCVFLVLSLFQFFNFWFVCLFVFWGRGRENGVGQVTRPEGSERHCSRGNCGKNILYKKLLKEILCLEVIPNCFHYWSLLQNCQFLEETCRRWLTFYFISLKYLFIIYAHVYVPEYISDASCVCRASRGRF